MDPKRFRMLLLVAVAASAFLSASVPVSAQLTLVATNANWKYWDEGTDEGIGWRAGGFNDSSWSNGIPQFGYGDRDETTVVRSNRLDSTRIITTYFRHTVNLDNAFDLTNVLVRVVRDDGVVVYINGTEVMRENMPTGDILFSTLAVSAIEDMTNFAHPDPALLVNGPNTIAVEIHQANPDSSDISFAFEMIANYQPVPPSVTIINPTHGSTVNAGNILVLANASDTDGSVTNVEFFANGVKIGQDSSAPYQILWVGATPGTYTLVAEATDSLGLKANSQTVAITVVPPPQGTLITLGATWKYLATNEANAPGPQWIQADYNEVGWGEGPAELGYGDGDEATPVPCGIATCGGDAPGKWITSYYRKKFMVVDPNQFVSLSATLVYDDGAVVYLNGQEIYRVNMPSGPVTWATVTGTGADYQPDVRSVDPGVLMAGENIIAVEMHQSGNTSSDVSFALQLVGLLPPNVSIITPANGSTFSTPVNFTVTADASDDGTITSVEFYAGETFLGFANNAPYSITVTNLTEEGYALTAKAYDNTGLSTVSAPVNITVVDPNPPALVGANATTNKVFLVFSKPVVQPSATTVGNYSLSPSVSILAAQFGARSNIVELDTAYLTPAVDYTLTVNNVRDRANNVIATDSQVIFNVVGFTSGDVGAPVTAGSSTPVTDGFNVVGAGTDIGGTSDQFQFNYESSKRVGDFDLRVRVASLTLSDVWAKAALMARESLDGNSKFAATVATPSVSGSFLSYRLTNGTAAISTGGGPVTYPNTWLRLKRQGTTLSGYVSTDGNAWSTLGSVTFLTLADDLYIGMAVSSRKPLQTATAEFRDFGAVTGGTIGGLKLKREPLGPSSRKTGLVISEIMYHPRSVLTGYDETQDPPEPIFTPLDLEFIELHNSNPFPEDLGDHRISGAVDYRFAPGTVMAPGSFLVVARNPSAVQSHYGISGVRGPWDGAETNGLPGGGGRVRLRSEGDSVLLEVNYEVDPPWPVAADGGGHSLVLVRPSYGENDVRAWAASAPIDGTPGRDEPYSTDPLDNVVINEFLAHTDLPQEDFVELYNHGNQPVNISGAYLTDEATRTNQFQIPNGTVIPARGYVSFVISAEANGFALSSGGERIYLVNSNRTRVIDVVKFEAQENGVSTGRYPDGNNAWYRMASVTPGNANSGVRMDPIVINEIMYNPITGDDDDEYIELYNRGGQAVDVSGWRFVDGIDYIIPPGTGISSGGYLVIAKNAARLITNYDHLNSTNTKGDYDGALGNGGERIALAMVDYEITTNELSGQVRTNVHYVVVNEVTYGDDGRWHKWSDGGGSSLELKDARSDNRHAANWADSDESSKGIWTTVEGIGTLGSTVNSPVNDKLQIFLLGIGECLVDDVEVKSEKGTGANLLANSGFESGLTSWTPQGSHDHSVASSQAFSGSGAMLLRAASRGDNGANLVRSAPFTGTLSTPLLRARVKWIRGWPEILLRVHGGSFEVGGRMNIQPNLGTPGAANGKAIANAGPAVYDVAHVPILPEASEPVVISARASDLDGVTLALKYRVEPGSTYSTAAMVDNGTGGDSVAGDGVYTATVTGQASGARMGFYIEATDSLGGVNAFPQDVFPTPPETRVFPLDAPNRECMVRWGETQLPGSLGTYRLWVNAANTTRWNVRRPVLNNAVVDATFVYNNSRVVYNMRPTYAGSPWHRGQMTSGPDGSQRVDYDIEFPTDDKFLGAQDAVWNNPGNPGGTSTTDGSAQSEQSSYTIFKEIGVQYNHRRFVHVFVNGSRRSQRIINNVATDFIFEDSQQPNSDIVEQWFPDDTGGDLYKIEDWFEFADDGENFNNTVDDADLSLRTIQIYRNPTANPETAFHSAAYRFMWRRRAVGAGESANDSSAIYAVINAAGAPAAAGQVNVTALDPLIDWEQWMRIFAVQHTIGNWDAYGYRRGKNAYTYKGAETGARFHQWTWDIDFTMGIGGDGPTYTLFESTDPRILAMWNTPAILRAYWRAYYDIINGPLNNAFMDPILDAKAAALRDNNVNFDAGSVTTIKNYVRDRRNNIAGQLTAVVNAPFTATVGAPSASVNTVTISGMASILIHEIRVNGIAYPTTWSGVNVAANRNPTNWTMTVTLTNGVNTFKIEAFDRKGRAIAGTARTNSVNYTGTPPSPEGNIVITEIMYNSPVRGADFVEIVNVSTNTAFDVSGWVVNGLDFSFPTGTVIMPGAYVLLVDNPVGYATLFTNTAPLFTYNGELNNGGETITIIKPGATPAQDLVVDKVKYDDDAPWLASADGSGASLSLIDVEEDNARVSNWTDAQGWRKVVLTGTVAGSTNLVSGQRGTNFMLLLTNAGTINIDDIYLCVGTVPEGAPNVVVNGDFELPLAGTWTGTGNHSTSFRDTSVSRSGSASLNIVASAAGSPTTSRVLQIIPEKGSNVVYTVSFWYLPTTNASTVTVRTAPGASFNFTVTTRPILATPGLPNSLVTNLPAYEPLWLNEVQPVNLTGIADNVGDRDPWIELYNSSASPISLEGYYLANNFRTLTQWQFPPGSTLGPRQFKIVWADGESSESTTTDWHTSFGLSGATGSVALVRIVRDEPQIVDYLNYAGQQAGRSYGDYPDGQVFTRQLFITPSPGQTNIVTGTVFINEWMAANTNTIQDPYDLQFEDWIELYNPSLEDVDLTGYSMSDSQSTPNEYDFPEGTVIPAGGFLLIWADNDDQQQSPGQLHATFGLDNSGDQIYLFSPANVVLDGVDFRNLRQTNDISMGRFPDAGPAPYYYMRNPTPGAPNELDPTGENRAPSIDTIGAKYVILGQTLQFQVVATDPDGDSLTYSISGAPSGASIGQNSGIFQFTPTPEQTPSETTVTVTVTDNGTPPRSANRSFTIHVVPPPSMAINRGQGSVSVGFPTAPGKNYQVQYKNNLQDPDWQNLGGPHLANDFSLEIDDNFAGPQRFYRILVLD
jgi:hypothetical protein